MPEAVASLLQTDGLAWLVFAVVLAGMVRGFAGFGTAMVFLPFAGQFLSPPQALTVMVVMDMIGPLPTVPRAIRAGHPRDVLRLALGMFALMPVGVWLLVSFAPEVFRYLVSGTSAVLLVMLIAGVRYRGHLSKPLIYATGGLGGILGGAAGMTGPPVIMLYMAADRPASVIRANVNLYLLLSEVAILIFLIAYGVFEPGYILLGLALAVPYLLANMAGASIFRPKAERVYRVIAYIIIAGAALNGLPLFD